MKKNILSIAILASMSAFAQQTGANTQMEVSANVQPGCFLTAENINFGNLAMPLSDNTVESNITVKCSTGVNLEMGISYNNINGFDYLISFKADYQNWTRYSITQNGEYIGDVACDDSGYVEFFTEPVRALYNAPSHQRQIDVFNACNNGKHVNTNRASEFTGANINYGTLLGLMSEEKIKYFISLPSDINTVWNSSNKHNLVSTGTEQSIAMRANIKRADNPTHRITPDTYSGTLTVVLTY